LRIQRNSFVLGLGVAAIWACAAQREGASDGGDDLGRPAGVGGASSAGGASGEVPPEMELEDTFKAPVVARNFIFTANPSSNKVALIDGNSLEVETLEAGHEPTYIAALPESAYGTGAIVLNVRSRDATMYLLPEDAGPTELTTARVPVHKGASAWAISPQGTFAIAWTANTDPASTDGNQDITIIEPGEKPVVTRIGVGFRPSQVYISKDESRAVVVSEPGVTVVELRREGTSGVRAEYPLPDAQDSSREVVVTPDGRRAFVRTKDATSISVVDLDNGSKVEVKMPGALSDLDLSLDGTLAVGVVRGNPTAPPGSGGMGGFGGEGGLAEGGAREGGAAGEPNGGPSSDSQVVLLPLPSGSELGDMRVIRISDVVGSVSLTKDGKTALVYSNAVANSRIWLLDTSEEDLRVVDVRSPVQAALPTPDGKNAVAILAPPSGSTRLGAFALIPLREDLPPRIEGTPLPTAQVAFAPNSRAVLLTTRATSGPSTAYVGRFPHLSVSEVALPSPPLAAGIIGTLNKGFVAQEHPEGRLTLIDLTSDDVTTLTGYELGSRVVE
jgi:hypothetical protein